MTVPPAVLENCTTAQDTVAFVLVVAARRCNCRLEQSGVQDVNTAVQETSSRSEVLVLAPPLTEIKGTLLVGSIAGERLAFKVVSVVAAVEILPLCTLLPQSVICTANELMVTAVPVTVRVHVMVEELPAHVAVVQSEHLALYWDSTPATVEAPFSLDTTNVCPVGAAVMAALLVGLPLLMLLLPDAVGFGCTAESVVIVITCQATLGDKWTAGG
jgi:hypothetical protein